MVSFWFVDFLEDVCTKAIKKVNTVCRKLIDDIILPLQRYEPEKKDLKLVFFLHNRAKNVLRIFVVSFFNI